MKLKMRCPICRHEYTLKVKKIEPRVICPKCGYEDWLEEFIMEVSGEQSLDSSN